jgi:hypothetical protein
MPQLKKSALAALFVAISFVPGLASARAKPEDALKGRVIASEKSIPTNWSSVGSYVAQLKGMNKGTFWYDKKTGKVTVQYAAFFAQPVNDSQVMLVIYDITSGAHTQKVATENFINHGDRVLFNSVTLDKEDLEGNKKYLFAIEYHHRAIASTQLILRMEGPHYSGKVSFSEDDTKDEKKE